MRIRANGLSFEVHEWKPSALGSAPPTPLLFLHGYMDRASTFAACAERLSRAGYTLFAPDLRGFGESDRVPSGGYYHFADYVADVEGIVDALSPDDPMHVIGHSMGGTIATLFAGSRPERVARLALLEGLGPMDAPASLAPLRMRRWLDDLRKHASRGQDRPMTIEQATARLAANHPRVDPTLLRRQAEALTTRADDGTATWAFDPLHRTTSPTSFSAEAYCAFAAAIACPVLFVSGGPLGFHPPDEEARLASFAQLSRCEIADAGHMMHWTAPDALASALADFFTPARRSS